MDHAPLVRVRQGIHHVAQQSHGFAHGKLAFPLQPLPERLPLLVRHHVVEEAIRLARIVERQDVGVMKLSRDLYFAEKPVWAERGSQVGTEDLDGHLALMLQVLGEVDGGHPARTEFPLDGVAAS